MNTNINAKRHIYVDLIRCIACILVVLVHVSAIDLKFYPIATCEWDFSNIMNCLGINGVPLFFMISGALILNEKYEISIKKLIIGKALPLLLVYYLTLSIYNLIPFLKGWVPWELYIIKEELLEAVIYGEGVYHLWFIPIILVLYLLVPILKDAFKLKRICEYYLILFLVVGILIPTLLLLELPGPMRRFFTYYQEKTSLFMLSGYIGYFVLGHYLHTFTKGLSKRKLLAVWIIFIVSFSATVLGCRYQSFTTGYTSSLFNTPLSLNVFLSSSGFYLLLKHYGSKIESRNLSSILGFFAKFTLGIYLFHPLVLENISIINDLNKILPNVVICMLARLLIVVVLTFVMVFSFKLIFKRIKRSEKKIC